MPSLIQSSFSAGEWAPEYSSRTDLPGYKEALASARNMLILPQGGATSRPGFRYVAPAKNASPSLPVRLERFSPAAGLNFILEFGPGYIRFFLKRAQVLSGGPLEVATPYAAGDIAGLSFTRQPGRLFIWHSAHPPQTLNWVAPTSFGLAAPVFADGPYLDAVPNSTTVTPSAAGATSVTLTSSSTVGINGGTGFRADDVGRPVRISQQTLGLSYTGATVISFGTNYNPGDTITLAGGVFIRPAVLTVTAIAAGGAVKDAVITDPGQYLVAPANPVLQGSTSGLGSGISVNPTWPQFETAVWLWGTITAWTSATVVTLSLGLMTLDALGNTLQGVFATTAALNTWRLGAWCPYEGYPQVGGATFQQRLLAFSNVNAPKRVWGSQIGLSNYLNMAPSLASGQVLDTSALAFDLDDDQADPIRWASPAGNFQTPEIGIGAGDGEFIVSPSSVGAALTQTNVQAYRETKYTSAPVMPLRIGKALLFVDGSGQRLRQWIYRWVAGGMIGPEPAPFGRHLMLKGLKQLDYAQSPHQIIWAVTNNGALVGLTYLADDPNGNVQVAAWHPHTLGGTYWGAPPFVESLAVATSADPTPYDEVWLSVLRNDPGGGLTRTIEVSTPPFRAQPLDQAVFQDSAISSPLTFPAMICTPLFALDPVTLQPVIPKRGDAVGFNFSSSLAVAGDLTPGTALRINNGTFRLTQVTSPTIIVAECMDSPNSSQPSPSGNWSYTKMATSFTGFSAFNGRAVAVIGDGALYPAQIVSGGTITVNPAASLVTAGYYANRELMTLDLDLLSPDGTTQMKTGRLDHLYLRVFETVGGQYGPDADHLDTIDPRDTDDLFDWAPRLFSDDLRVAMPGGSSAHRTVFVRQPNPWPMTLLAVVVKGGTTELAPK